MSVKRAPRSHLPLLASEPADDDDDENLTFFQRFKRDSERNRKNGSSNRVLCIFLRSLMIFIAITEPYVFKYYIVPYLFDGFSSWTIYYINVLVFFCVINMFTNWACLILFDTSFTKTKDDPFIQYHHTTGELPDTFSARIQQAASQRIEDGGHCGTDAEEVLSWHYCDKCDMRVPPRSHHCKICKKCILKRDHHCFMVGTCIGFKNQRYFVMMCLYISICGLIGGTLTLIYVKNVIWSELNSWVDIMFPVTVVRWMFGYVKGIHCLCISHMYIEIIFGALCFLYFNSQLAFLNHGKTPYEVSKKLPLRNTNSFSKNMKSVFGDFWALNLVFPMTIVFRQHDDGLAWDSLKIDNNCNEVKNDHRSYTL